MDRTKEMGSDILLWLAERITLRALFIMVTIGLLALATVGLAVPMIKAAKHFGETVGHANQVMSQRMAETTGAAK